jgi:hypothetical protein
VGVRHEGVTHTKEVSGRQWFERPQIEQQGPPFEGEGDVERGVAEGRVNQLRPKALRHRRVGVPTNSFVAMSFSMPFFRLLPEHALPMHQRCRAEAGDGMGVEVERGLAVRERPACRAR